MRVTGVALKNCPGGQAARALLRASAMRFLFVLAFAVAACNSGAAFEPCPTAAPTAGTPCTTYDPPVCEYGSSNDPRCDTALSCEYESSLGPDHGQWAAVVAGTCPATTGNPSACPASLGDVPRGQACTAEGVTCDYPRATCGCRQQFRDAFTPTPTWSCVDLDPACPDARPLFGSACPAMSTPVLRCDYGDCFDEGHVAEACTPGAGWERAATECSPPKG